MAYLNEKLGLQDGKITEKLQKELGEMGFDAELMSLCDEIVPKGVTSASSSTAPPPEEKKKKRLGKRARDALKMRKEVDEVEPEEAELNYLSEKLGIVDGKMSEKFLQDMENCGFDNDFMNLLDDIIPKKRKIEGTDEPHNVKALSKEELKKKKSPEDMQKGKDAILEEMKLMAAEEALARKEPKKPKKKKSVEDVQKEKYAILEEMKLMAAEEALARKEPKKEKDAVVDEMKLMAAEDGNESGSDTDLDGDELGPDPEYDIDALMDDEEDYCDMMEEEGEDYFGMMEEEGEDYFGMMEEEGEDYFGMMEEEDDLDEGSEEAVDDESDESGLKSSEENKPFIEAVGRYVPPALRRKQDEVPEATVEAKLNSLLNKISEGNLAISAQKMTEVAEELRRISPKIAHMAVARALVPAAVQNPHVNVLVTACYVAIVCALSINVHASMGAAVVLDLLHRFRSFMDMKEYTSEQLGVLKNVIIFISLLFYFGLLPPSVPFGIFRALYENSNLDDEIRVDCALTTLRYSGKTLRSRYTEDFKNILVYLLEKNNKYRYQKENHSSVRIKFLLEDLEDLKNNKNVNFTVMERFDSTKTWLDSTELLRGKKMVDCTFDLPFEFPALPPAGWDADPLSVGHHVKLLARTQSISPLWEEARQQGMNTEIRKAVYVALMGAEDDAHASIRINEVVKHVKQITDVCNVITHCSLRAEINNPYYSLVMLALCDRPGSWGKKYAHAFKQSIGQRIQEVHTYNLPSTLNLAHLFASGVASDAVQIPLRNIRLMQFESDGFSGTLGVFLRSVLEKLLMFLERDALEEIFAPLKQHTDVQEGVLVVLENLVTPRAMSRNDAEEITKIDFLRTLLSNDDNMDDLGEWEEMTL